MTGKSPQSLSNLPHRRSLNSRRRHLPGIARIVGCAQHIGLRPQPVELLAHGADAAPHVLQPLPENAELLLQAGAGTVDVAGDTRHVV